MTKQEVQTSLLKSSRHTDIAISTTLMGLQLGCNAPKVLYTRKIISVKLRETSKVMLLTSIVFRAISKSCISRKLLQIYGVAAGDTRYRSKATRTFWRFVPFTNENIPEFIFNNGYVTGTFIVDETSQITAKAKSLQKDISNR